ncbi:MULTISPECIES: hypothetical protein [unclassified Nocardioides]|uniref:hypothetical protein n=1 Tax=unclassified Nocardioides TaxID=2615069 RepID=UPI003014905E
MSASPPVTPGWSSVGLCWEGEEFDLLGIDPWGQDWVPLDRRIVVAHPSRPAQRHCVDVWTVRTPEREVTFAAGEMPDLAWAFFLPDSPRAAKGPMPRWVRGAVWTSGTLLLGFGLFVWWLSTLPENYF